MSDEIESLKKEVKRHLGIGASLIVLAGLGTAVAKIIPFDSAFHMIAGLGIAIFMACLVLYFFMHLSNEKKMIYKIIGFTFFFFLGLLFLTLLAYWDHIGRVFQH